MKSPKIVAKVLLIDAENKGLIVIRSETDDNRAGQADLPGGEVDAGETMEEGAVREIMEETGLTVKPSDLTLIRIHTAMKNGENIVRAFYATRSFSGEITLSHEHSSFYWLDVEEMPGKFIVPGWGEGISYALENSLL